MKKVIIVLSLILIFILLLFIFLPSLFSKNNNNNLTINKQSFFPFKSSTSSQNTQPKISPIIIASFYSQDFNAEYSSDQKKYLISKKTATADDKIKLWLTQNNIKQEDIRVLTDLPEGNLKISDAPPNTQIKYFEKESKIIDGFLNLLSQTGKFDPITTVTPSITNPFPLSTGQPIQSNYIYYSQCNGPYDNYSLPQGCTLCKAGCGPTTVSMILTSYLQADYNPQKIVDLYTQKGFYAGCDGSSYSDAKAVLNQMGLKTTDYMIYNNATINEVADDFKNYLKNGWTLFTLGRYCDAGCGHFFWITTIDENNNVWAYDPYYGRLSATPFNENRYYPFPKYRVAFGVKKI